MIRSIIVENEIKAQKLLISILRDFVGNVEVLGTATRTDDAQELINRTKPDLVFLDIELDDGNAFDLLEKTDHRNFKLIFLTAYDRYALKAFQYEAVDYIVKPYSPNEIIKAVKRVDRIPVFELYRDELLALAQRERTDSGRITVSNSDGLQVLKVAEIVRLEGDRSYCTFYLVNGERILVSRPLKDFEKVLPADAFFRVHQTHLVNLNYVKKISTEDGGFILMENRDQVPLAKRRRKEFIRLFEK
jgi:two-component system LytT family response regulator